MPPRSAAPPRLTPSASRPRRAARAFTLIELLVTIAVIATLLSLLLPAVAGSREAARAVACSSSLRQLAAAVGTYANDFKGLAPPGAANFIANLSRWHGARARVSDPFAPAGGSLTTYIGDENRNGPDGSRVCPSFRSTLAALGSVDRPATPATGRAPSPAATLALGFERGCGGYGYNNAFLGVWRTHGPDDSFTLNTDRSGAPLHSFLNASRLLAFADAALDFSSAPASAPAGVSMHVIEYSFLEPRFWPDNPSERPDPSIHFRHALASARSSASSSRAQAAFLDGHAEALARTLSYSSGLYSPPYGPAPAAPSAPIIDGLTGWTGQRDSNELFMGE